MKKSAFWKLGLTAMLAFGLSACTSTSSSDEDVENFDFGNSSEGTSSSSKGNSSASTKSSSSSAKLAGCDAVTASLAIPGDLQVAKNGDNKWLLYWSYSANEDRPESSFLVEVLNMADSIPQWKTLDSTNAEVVMYNLVGASKADKYYRVSARDECGVSRSSNTIQVSSTGATSTSNEELAVPTGLDLDTLGENMWSLHWDYEDNENRPEQGFKLQSLNLNDDNPSWKDAGTTNKGVHAIKIDGSKNGGLLFHVAARDTNGISKYSGEIAIPRVPDSTSLVTNTELALSSPTNLKLDSLGNNKWQLSWSYTNNANRVSKGFQLEYLNVNDATPAWTAKDSSGAGVNYKVIDATKYGGYFVRVAAFDTKGTSLPSTEIKVPSEPSKSVTLAAPYSLRIDSIGQNVYQLSWSYTENKDRPSTGFVVEKLDINKATPQWEVAASPKKGVKYYKITLSSTDNENIYYRVAAKDDAGTSDYTNDIVVPAYTDYSIKPQADLAAPTNLAIVHLQQNTYRLTWDYEKEPNRPETGFILQRINPNDATPTWDDDKNINKGVLFANIDADPSDEITYRVAAIDDNGRSDYSNVIVVPSAKNCKGELDVPTNFMAERIAPSVWRLKWDYTKNPVCDEDGFVIQMLDPKQLNAEWINSIETAVNVSYVNLSGLDYLNNYFRVAAFRNTDTTVFSNEIQILRSTPYSADYPFQAPSIKARVYGDSPYEFQVVVTEDFPNHAIINSEYTANLVYQFRWNNEKGDEWSIKDAPVIESSEYETTATKDGTLNIDQLCRSYASVRVIWTDTEGNSDSTDWTAPIGPLYNEFEYLPDDPEKIKPCAVQ